MDKKNLQYWMANMGYKWTGESHPTHPIRKPYTIPQFDKDSALTEIKSLEEDGYIARIDG